MFCFTMLFLLSCSDPNSTLEGENLGAVIEVVRINGGWNSFSCTQIKTSKVDIVLLRHPLIKIGEDLILSKDGHQVTQKSIPVWYWVSQ